MTEAEEKAAEAKEKAAKAGKLQKYICQTKCYWDTSRFNPGDVAEFEGNPPENFPKHHFERV